MRDDDATTTTTATATTTTGAVTTTGAATTATSSTTETLGEWLSRGPFALTLSSGFFGFFAHAGVVRALADAGLVPERVSGSSAGALIGAAVACGLDGATLERELFALRKEDFWDPWPGLGLLRGRKFRQRLDALLPVETFAELPRPFAVSAYTPVGFRTEVLDDGPLAEAVQASCTYPGLFQPVWIRGRPFWDGGIADRPGLLGMPTGTRVLYHHLVSTSVYRRRRPLDQLLPRRPDLRSLVVEGLPRLGPDRLDGGPAVFALAKDAAARALDTAVVDERVVTRADEPRRLGS